MNDIQRKILNDLRYRSFMSYSSLWNKKGDSSKFAYHLRELEKRSFVEKKEDKYCLTSLGIKLSDYLSFVSPQPISVVVLVLKKGNKVLIKQREKYPFKGYKEFCASKARHEETLEEVAKNRLLSKLEVEGDLTYKGIEFLHTKERDKIVMNHHLHIFLVENVNKEPKGGEWVLIPGFNPDKAMPHLKQTLKIATSKGFSIASGDMIKEGDKIIGYKPRYFKGYSKTI